MSVLCILFSVLLVTAIFGMADMFLRIQLSQSYQTDGNWHVILKNISEEDAALIRARPTVRQMSWYGILNYKALPAYSLYGKPVALCGVDPALLSDIFPSFALIEGNFPIEEGQAILTLNAKTAHNLQLGDSVTVNLPERPPLTLTISGFVDATSLFTKYDSYGIFLSTAYFRTIAPKEQNVYYVQFSTHCNIQKEISAIKAQFQLSDTQVSENFKLLGLLGQSNDPLMLQLYNTAMALIALVLLAGILMITSSLNSNVTQRIQFFGMIRCIGATPKQIMRLVRTEALQWCRFAIPLGVGLGILIIWILCALLRWLSPYYFAGIPVFSVSLPSILTGILVGLLTVLIAARAPAKRAASVSPLTAISGNAAASVPILHAANTAFFKVDTAMGIHHAKANQKNFFLMVGSFAFSILLFLSFSTILHFMNHAVTPLRPWTPDLSIISTDNTCSIPIDLLNQENPLIERIYGRMFAYQLPLSCGDLQGTVDLISYEKHQFAWAEKSLLEGSLENMGLNTVLTVYNPDNPLTVGDNITLNCNGQQKQFTIAGVLSASPFHSQETFGTMICTEEAFQSCMGPGCYTILDIQLSPKATDQDVNAIRTIVGEKYKFSDARTSNAEAMGAYYAFALFVYGFLSLIALITTFHIVNSISMSVTSRIKQYGAMRAIGMDSRQLLRMVTAEASTYALCGCITGCAIGLPVHHWLFVHMVSNHWGDP